MRHWSLVLILVVAAGCIDAPATTTPVQTIVTTAPPPQTGDPHLLDECEEQTAISLHDACYYNKAVEKGDYKYCELMFYSKDYCLYEIAIKTDNIDLCSSEICYYNVALNTNNYEYCELLTEGKNNCILDIAKQTKDSAKCAQLNETC